MNIATIIFSVLVLIFSGLLGLKWNGSTPLNIFCKLTCILTAFWALVVIVKGAAVMPFLIVSGLVCLGTSIIWSSNGGLNVFIKTLFSGLTLFAAILLLIRL